MCEIPLTTEQSIFAAEHHNLVYKFLNKHHLSEDEYYDVVIFGYLKAVKDYLSRPELQIYTFTTIAWKTMSKSLYNYERDLCRQKRAAEVISIHIGLHEDEPPLEQLLPAEDKLMQQLEAELLLHELARKVSKQQMDVVHLKTRGYGVRDIARNQNITIKRVRELLDEVYGVIKELCYE